MRIRNLKSHDLYLPYAGLKRGAKVKGNSISTVELPAERFNDKLLQRDWKRGLIEVLLSDADRVELGSVVSGLKSESVKVEETIVPPTPEPTDDGDESQDPVDAEETVEEEPEPEKATEEVDEEVPEAPAEVEEEYPADTEHEVVVPPVVTPPPVVKPVQSLQFKQGTIRVHEAAKSAGVTSRSFLNELKRRDIEVGNHMSLMKQEDMVPVIEHFRAVNTPKAPQPPSVATTVPGQPTIPTMANQGNTSGLPSLSDLADANAKITLGQPDLSKSVTGKATMTPVGIKPEDA